MSGFAIPLVNCSEAGHKSGLADKPTLVMNSRNERKDTTYFDPVINLLLEITFWNMGIDELPFINVEIKTMFVLKIGNEFLCSVGVVHKVQKLICINNENIFVWRNIKMKYLF